MNHLPLFEALSESEPYYTIRINGRVTALIEPAKHGRWSKTLGSNVPRPHFLDEWPSGDPTMLRRVYPLRQAQALVRTFRKNGMDADMEVVR